MIFSHSSFPIPRFSNTQALCAVVAKKYFIQYSAWTELLLSAQQAYYPLSRSFIFVIVSSLTYKGNPLTQTSYVTAVFMDQCIFGHI